MNKLTPFNFDKEIFNKIDRRNFFYMPHITIIFSILFITFNIIEHGLTKNNWVYIICVVLGLLSIIIPKLLSLKYGFVYYLTLIVSGFFYYSIYVSDNKRYIVILLYVLFTIQTVFLLDRPISIIYSTILSVIFTISILVIHKTQIMTAIEILLFIGFITVSIIEAKNWLRHLVLKNLEKSRETQNVSLKILGKVCELYDSDTSLHLQRVEILVLKLVQYLIDEKVFQNYITPDYLEDIKSAAYLHDIGKIGIRKSIITKEGRLSDEEFDEIKKHTLIGYEIVKEASEQISSDNIYTLALEIVRHHHERWDGSGYPDQLSGEMIPLSARIMAIIDVFDALISNRPYKKTISFNDAVLVIQEGSGSHFDPKIVEVFIKYSVELYNSILPLLQKEKIGVT